MKEENENPETSVEHTIYKQRSIWKNGVETIVNKDGIFWVNEKHVEEGLDHKNLPATTLKHLSHHRKHRYELVNEPKKQSNRTFIDEKLAFKVIMDRRKT